MGRKASRRRERRTADLASPETAWAEALAGQILGFHKKSLFSALQTLDLSGCAQLDKAGLAHLRGFTALQTLNLSGCELVTDEVLECLKGLGGLGRLHLNRCRRVTDAGLAHLHQLTALRVLSLTGCTQLTGAGLERLGRALPGCEIRVG